MTNNQKNNQLSQLIDNYKTKIVRELLVNDDLSLEERILVCQSLKELLDFWFEHLTYQQKEQLGTDKELLLKKFKEYLNK